MSNQVNLVYLPEMFGILPEVKQFCTKLLQMSYEVIITHLSYTILHM